LGIRGSAALATAPLAEDLAVAQAEALEPGELLRVPVAGELIGAARVRARFAPIPYDAFDRAAKRLGAEEQAAYFHALRLAFGEGAIHRLSRALCEARGLASAGESLASARTEIAAMLEDGHSREQVESCIRVIARRAERDAALAKGA